MTDSILALLIISIGLGSLAVCQVQLHYQQRQHLIKLTAARLLKEASDGYRIQHRQTVINRATITRSRTLIRPRCGIRDGW